jgi:hypothetical protein
MTLAPTFDQVATKELNDALSTLRMELSLFIADGYQGDSQDDSYDDDRHSQEWLDMH